MDFNEYQTNASTTDQITGSSLRSIVVPFLGLAGEAGSLLTQYKKYLRDGDKYEIFDERIAEELGDILWYIADIATKFNIKLDDIARDNLRKVTDRWHNKDEGRGQKFFDAQFPPAEQLPRFFLAEIVDRRTNLGSQVTLTIDGKTTGAQLTDNAYEEDGYRYHDVFHLANAAVLRWSPVARAIMKRKRKSNPAVDMVEDGGRAAAIEEGISAMIFAYAENHSFLEGITTIDWTWLRIIRDMTKDLEVKHSSLHDWEQAILQGYEVWRQVKSNRGGKVECDLLRRSIRYVGASSVSASQD
jgi:NTP pyrophosphatase (non-canonical NTP hydrolase)